MQKSSYELTVISRESDVWLYDPSAGTVGLVTPEHREDAIGGSKRDEEGFSSVREKNTGERRGPRGRRTYRWYRWL
jgi:hypothetical protein